MPAWLNLPNLITLTRVVLTPWIVAGTVAGRPRQAFLLFFIAGWTDFFDGWAARRLGASSSTGAYLDPIADKLLLSGVFVALALAHVVPWWYVGLVFARDLYILLGVAFLIFAIGRRQFPPSRWGKVSTFFQISTAGFFMIHGLAPGAAAAAVAWTSLWISSALTAFSGVHYTWRGTQWLRTH